MAANVLPPSLPTMAAVYAPTMISSPCAMLMTPATPKMIASPIAAITRIATTLKPLRNCVMMDCSIRCPWLLRVSIAHACRGAGQRPCNGCAPGL